MINKTIKNKGRYYTPPELAEYVASLTITNSNSTILDPAFGNGALLLAAFKVLKEKCAVNANKQLFGYDIFPLCIKFQKKYYSGILKEENLKINDFFTISPKNHEKRSHVIMNPPFIRHHKIDHSQYEKIAGVLPETEKITKFNDMWAYFVFHSLKFIKKGGSLSVILPWSFVQAEYAKKIREYLIDKFESINVIVIGKHFFENTQERVLILHAKNFGVLTDKISIGYTYDIPKESNFLIDIDKNVWINSPWMTLVSRQFKKHLEKFENKVCLRPLSDFVDVKIGTVTGANPFFVIDKKTIQKNKIPMSVLKPIITTSKDLRKLTVDSVKDWNKYLLVIPEYQKIENEFFDYVKSGENLGYDKKSHTRKRKIWYSIPTPKKCDGFLHYMTKEIPFIVLNHSELFSTNTVHQIFFKEDIDENTKRWIQFSIFSSISQLSIEILGKTYGGGILKIEPSAAKKILVYDGNGKDFPDQYEDEINKLLKKGNREEIIDLVDKWFIRNLEIPDNLIFDIKTDFYVIRKLRQQ